VETQSKRLSFLIAGLLLAFVSFRAAAGSSQMGSDLYRQYCSVCHGVHGAGDGPVADALSTRPADLTRLRATHSGKFPELRVMAVLRGEDTPVHGRRQMPNWGQLFLDEAGGHREVVQIRGYALLKYIEQLQIP